MNSKTEVPLYLKVAQSLEDQIQKGTFALGDQVPSVRKLSSQHRVSVSTVLQAYFWLENRGWIEARPKSGFYVRTPSENLHPEPAYRPRESKPAPVTNGELVLEMIRGAGKPIRVSLSAGVPSPQHLPTSKLNSIIRRISREAPGH